MDINDDFHDYILPDVLEYIIEQNSATTFAIQRKFSVGYARAARMMDYLLEKGYIGPQTSYVKSGPVLITRERFDELFRGHGKPTLPEYAEGQKAIVEKTLSRLAGREVTVEKVTPAAGFIRYELPVSDPADTKVFLRGRSELEQALGAAMPVTAYYSYQNKRFTVEVPRIDRSVVGLNTLLYTPEFGAASPFSFIVGQGAGGELVLHDLCKDPHILIGGRAGIGKSTFLYSLISALAQKNRPPDLQFILCDPKHTAFSNYERSALVLDGKIVCDVKDIAATLEWLYGEMERRYEVLTKARKRNIDEYNANPRRSGEQLPHLILIIDEFAECMKSEYGRAIEERVGALAGMARAAGIHMMISTADVSADVITGFIKSNLVTRVAFKVSEPVQSRIILDCEGAERLAFPGDMLYFPVTRAEPVRVQGAYARDVMPGSYAFPLKEEEEPSSPEEKLAYEYRMFLGKKEPD